MTRRVWLDSLAMLAIGWTPAADFEALFDGVSLAGWTSIGDEPGAWKVEAGLLTTLPGSIG